MSTQKTSEQPDGSTETNIKTRAAASERRQGLTPGERLMDVFNHMTYETIDELDNVYSPTVHFRDPIQEFSTLPELKKYLGSQYKNVITCRFQIESEVTQKSTSSIEWTMKLKHKYLNLGKEICLRGVSLVTEDPKTKLITQHKDFFDVSAFVLKSIPGVDFLTRALRSN